jgi:DNA ligase-1
MLSCILITYPVSDSTIFEKSWAYPVLISTRDGGKRRWQAGIRKNEKDDFEIVTASGTASAQAKIQFSKRTIKTNLSHRTEYEQAILELNSKVCTRMKKDGFVFTDDSSISSPTTIPFPMLAESFSKVKSPLTYPLDVQPKLDGVRCLVQIVNDSIKLSSRGRGDFSHLLPIFEDSLKSILALLPSGSILDGELIVNTDTGGENFAASVSVVRKTKTPLTLTEKASLKYVIFSQFHLEDKRSYTERQASLLSVFSQLSLPNVILIDSFIVHNEIELYEKYEIFLKKGHEGIMLYQPNGLYESGKRSKQLLKLKPFEEMEGKVERVIAGRGKESNAALLEVEFPKGGKFGAEPIRVIMHPTGPIEEREKWMRTPSLVLGRQVTFKYQGFTADGVPRFPVARAFRDYE